MTGTTNPTPAAPGAPAEVKPSAAVETAAETKPAAVETAAAPAETKPAAVETAVPAPAKEKVTQSSGESLTHAVSKTDTAPASTAAPEHTAAAPASSAAPAAATSAAAQTTAPPASASQTLGKILAITASVIGGLLPSIPVGAITAGATVAEAGLRAIAEFLVTKGSGNALTEAQAEAALKTLLAGLATLAAPLPTPETLESQG